MADQIFTIRNEDFLTQGIELVQGEDTLNTLIESTPKFQQLIEEYVSKEFTIYLARYIHPNSTNPVTILD